MSIKLRLDYFLMRGGLFELGDNVSGVDIAMHLKTWNSIEVNGADLSMEVKSFAPRKNNGSQPVPYDFPVIVNFESLDKWRVTAGQFDWCLDDGLDNIESWKPDIKKLIEQQIEYDKQQEQPIEELMINAKGNNMPTYTQEMKEAGKYAPIGSKVQIINNSKYDLEYGEDILGLEVTVKSEPIYIGLITKIQVVEYAGIAYCFETDMIFPFKSKEEIEVEEAKLKQIKRLACKYSVVHSELELENLFSKMQRFGDLSEIILPLEKNK